MKIKNRHTDEEKEVSFHSWYYGLTNKKDFIIADWDLVFWQTIKDGEVKDEKVIDRDHALRIIKSDDKRNTMRELTDAEWSSLKNQFYDSPEVLSTAEKKQIFKSKELIKSCYKEGLFFDDFFMNHLGRKLTRDAAKKYLIELNQDGEINSLPYDMQSESESASLEEDLSKPKTDHLPQATPASHPKQKPETNDNQSKSIIDRLLKIAPLGIWITAIISTMLIVYFNGCK